MFLVMALSARQVAPLLNLAEPGATRQPSGACARRKLGRSSFPPEYVLTLHVFTRVALLVLLATTSVAAQGVSITLEQGGVEEFIRFDGRTLVHETRGFDGFVQTETVVIGDLNL